MNFLNKHKDFADNVNRYYNMAKNIGIIYTGLIGLFTKLLENKTFAENLKISNDIILTNIYYNNFWIVILGILILLSILKFLYNAINAKSNNIKQMLLLLKMIHVTFIHDIRSKIVETDMSISRKIEITQQQHGDIDLLYNNEFEKLKENIQPYVDALGSYLSEYRNKKISVCVKTFLNGKTNKKDYLDEELITLARSYNTRNARNRTHHSIVRNNTDFIDLCCGQSSFFSRTNLKELYDAGLYKNDSPKWWLQYNCTLVTPIRYYNKDGENENVKIDIDVIGFLCIDCKENIEEWKNNNSFELQLLAIIADSLYSYIRVFYNCFEKIGYFEKEQD